jgi:hypothetical protein
MENFTPVAMSLIKNLRGLMGRSNVSRRFWVRMEDAALGPMWKRLV